MDFEQILQKAQQKAQRLALEVEHVLKKNNSISPEEISIRVANKLFKTKIGLPESVSTVSTYRLTKTLIDEIYQKTSLLPCWTKYWFYNDLKIQPLIQADRLIRNKATPLGTLCFFYRQEILQNKRVVSDYVRTNSVFIDSPSHKWFYGQMAQLTDLTCSYLLGFHIGYEGHQPIKKSSTIDLINGYEDGQTIRKYFLESKILELEPDIFENEEDSYKVSELYRIGYYHTEND